MGAEGANGGDGEGNVTNMHTRGRGRRRAEVVDSGLTGNSVVVGETGGVGVHGGWRWRRSQQGRWSKRQ